MAERPIIFSGPMVRAILADRKFQTRRVLEPQPRHRANLLRIVGPSAIFCDGDHEKNEDCEEHKYSVRIRYAKGDVLWVREAWADLTETHGQPWERFNESTQLYERGIKPFIWYMADGDPPDFGGGEPVDCQLRSPIHMPRWASRITLRVTDVRVQRLQDISEEDAEEEGVFRHIAEHSINKVFRSERGPMAIRYFRETWDTINAKRGYPWESNPWVAAISFDRATQGGENG